MRGSRIIVLCCILCTCDILNSNAKEVCRKSLRYSPEGVDYGSSKCVDYTTNEFLENNRNQNGISSFCHYFERDKAKSKDKPGQRRGGARDSLDIKLTILDELSKIETNPDDYKFDDKQWSQEIEMGVSYIRNDNFAQAMNPYIQDPTAYSVDPKLYAKSVLPHRSINNTRRPPDPGSPNPWFVEATGISIKGDLLHNWLHFRVFMNRSVRDLDKLLHRKEEKRHRATGYISAMIMMIKDQEGFPIGDFTQELPCHKTCRKYSQSVHYGNNENAVPCAYTPPRATAHPGMFVFDVDPRIYRMPPLPPEEEETTTASTSTSTSNTNAGAPGGTTGSTTTTPKPTTTTVLPINDDDRDRKDGVREVHATWSFNQDICNFVSEIHVQTLIFEEFYVPESKMCNVNVTNCKYYGWSAQYNILYPKGKDSLGAADYVNIEYWKHRDQTFGAKEINCHVPFFDALKPVDGPYTKGANPENILKGSDSISAVQVIKVPSAFNFLTFIHKAQYTASRSGNFPQYYGSPNIGAGPAPYDKTPKCRNALLLNSDAVAETNLKAMRAPRTPTFRKFLSTNKGVLCPCPALPSEEPIEKRTADPAKLHSRLIHASHMALAYMFLVPLSCFVARYYKETFITVFCFQEYWWFMWHVVLLLIAAAFTFGAILSLYRGNSAKLVVSENLLVHKIMGFFSITVFAIEIFTGFFRRANPAKRLKQIFLHWLIGNLNILCAVGSMFAMAFEKESGMSCDVVYTMLVWLFFVILWFVLLDIHMKNTDKKMDLQPPRSYLPPPVVRLFHKDAPGRNFRMMMLAIYIINLLIVQYFISYYIWNSEGKTVCADEWSHYFGGPKTLNLEDYEDEDNYGDYDEEQ